LIASYILTTKYRRGKAQKQIPAIAPPKSKSHFKRKPITISEKAKRLITIIIVLKGVIAV
jgi:hypothetical protein